MERGFKGVWIPKEIWLAKELTLTEKVFLTEIDSLDNADGCFAGNEHFSNFFSLSKNRCSEIIKSLEKKEYITIQYIYRENSKEIQKRILKINRKLIFGFNTPSENRLTPSENRLTPSENCEDNNTINNTSIINNIYSSIIDYLNKKADTRYRSTSKKTKSLITARLNEGFTEEDFYKVIDNKSSEWLGTNMQQYLRPETLFGTKFEGYLNQKIGGISNGQCTNRKHGDRWSTKKNKGSFNVKTECNYGELSEEDRRRAEKLI